MGTLISFDLDLFHSLGEKRACKGRVSSTVDLFARCLFSACMCASVSGMIPLHVGNVDCDLFVFVDLITVMVIFQTQLIGSQLE